MKEFTLKYHKEVFEALHFVVQAVSKDETREALTHICVSGCDVVATDGVRLHKWDGNDGILEDGFYKAVKLQKTKLALVKVDWDMQFPEYKRVIPEPEGLTSFNRVCNDKNAASLAFVEVIRACPECYGFDFKLFEPAQKYMTSFCQKDPASPLLMVSADCSLLSVVMPLCRV